LFIKTYWEIGEKVSLRIYYWAFARIYTWELLRNLSFRIYNWTCCTTFSAIFLQQTLSSYQHNYFHLSVINLLYRKCEKLLRSDKKIKGFLGAFIKYSLIFMRTIIMVHSIIYKLYFINEYKHVFLIFWC
jgi:hypothetical protein